MKKEERTRMRQKKADIRFLLTGQDKNNTSNVDSMRYKSKQRKERRKIRGESIRNSICHPQESD